MKEDEPTKQPKKQKTCHTCNNVGEIEVYFDAGDHFGAGTSPFSEWITVPCPKCRGEKR